MRETLARRASHRRVTPFYESLFKAEANMSQWTASRGERRAAPRSPTAFAFWFRRPGADAAAGGWMLEVSQLGGRFLSSLPDSPDVGERLTLREMHAGFAAAVNPAPELPRFARVVRVDPPGKATREIAVRFETDADEPLAAWTRQTRVAACSLPSA